MPSRILSRSIKTLKWGFSRSGGSSACAEIENDIHLPIELWIEIFHHLQGTDLKSLIQTCRGLRGPARNILFKDLTVEGQLRGTSPFGKIINNLGSIVREIQATEFCDPRLMGQFLECVPNLERLSLEERFGVLLNEGELKTLWSALEGLTHLRYLKVDDNSPTDSKGMDLSDALIAISGLEKLISLELVDVGVVDAATVGRNRPPMFSLKRLVLTGIAIPSAKVLWLFGFTSESQSSQTPTLEYLQIKTPAMSSQELNTWSGEIFESIASNLKYLHTHAVSESPILESFSKFPRDAATMCQNLQVLTVDGDGVAWPLKVYHQLPPTLLLLRIVVTRWSSGDCDDPFKDFLEALKSGLMPGLKELGFRRNFLEMDIIAACHIRKITCYRWDTRYSPACSPPFPRPSNLADRLNNALPFGSPPTLEDPHRENPAIDGDSLIRAMIVEGDSD